MEVCGAKTRSGGKCRNAPMTNGRCRMHGGKSTGAPPEKMKGNQNAVKWGFWSRYVTEEQLQIMRDVDGSEPADILWANILISYSSIIRAQKIMFVRDQDDIVTHLKRQKGEEISNEDGVIIAEKVTEREWEFQYPWDRHASFMTAQSRAMSELRSLIKDFLEISDSGDMRRKKLELMQKDIELKNLEIEKLREGGAGDDDGLNVVVDYGDDNV